MNLILKPSAPEGLWLRVQGLEFRIKQVRGLRDFFYSGLGFEVETFTGLTLVPGLPLNILSPLSLLSPLSPLPQLTTCLFRPAQGYNAERSGA